LSRPNEKRHLSQSGSCGAYSLRDPWLLQYSIGMKFRILAPLIAAALLLSGLAAAQNKPEAGKSDPLSLVKIAVNVASNTQHQDLNGFLAIYVDSETWAAALKDGDLGPFLKLKEVKPGRSAVLFFSPEKDNAISVFFDGNSPFGVTAAKAKNGKIEAGVISSAYKPVSKEMLKDAGQNLQFSKSDVATDDGQALTAFEITSGGKKAAS
jgi:hypothetical protein